MKEKLIKWIPKDIIQEYEIEKISFIDHELKVVLLSESDLLKIEVYFSAIISEYQYTKIKYCMCVDRYSNVKKSGFCFHSNWTFFKVENSKYIKWLSKTSCTVSDSYKMQHFIVADKKYMVEVVDPGDPEIKFL